VCCSEVREEFSTWNILQEHVEKPVVMIGPNPGRREGGREVREKGRRGERKNR